MYIYIEREIYAEITQQQTYYLFCHSGGPGNTDMKAMVPGMADSLGKLGRIRRWLRTWQIE